MHHNNNTVNTVNTINTINNINNISYYDMVYNQKYVYSPNIKNIDRMFDPPKTYPIENNVPMYIRDKFIKTKRYNDNFLMPGYEVYLNNGDLIDVSMITPNILAGSAPIVSELTNFWKMILENDIRIIVSLTPWIENNRVKADIYFNPSINGSINFNNIYVYTISDVTHNLIINPNIKILKIKIVDTTATATTITTHSVRIIYHLHFVGWPDMGVPSIKDMYSLLLVYSYLKNKLEQNQLVQNQNKLVDNNVHNIKTFVHCSAGIGRTGTFIVLCKAISQINKNIKIGKVNLWSINIQDIILNYRSKRKGFVQTQQQVDFIIKFLSIYLSKIIKDRNDKIIIDLHI